MPSRLVVQICSKCGPLPAAASSFVPKIAFTRPIHCRPSSSSTATNVFTCSENEGDDVVHTKVPTTCHAGSPNDPQDAISSCRLGITCTAYVVGREGRAVCWPGRSVGPGGLLVRVTACVACVWGMTHDAQASICMSCDRTSNLFVCGHLWCMYVLSVCLRFRHETLECQCVRTSGADSAQCARKKCGNVGGSMRGKRHDLRGCHATMH